jgi:hypothetical protein
MRSIIQKIHFGHISLLVIFPIILAFINPNWIFNTYIIDDYIYLGYQIDLPAYIGWYPSDSHYFIERISWLLPTYYVRQLFSPLVANFVIHLSVYYLAIFSVYGILNRLFNQRIALITCLLMGQFSLFLRAVGWDYVDGYSLALLALCATLLTYAATATKARWYLIGAGAIASIMAVAQIFNIFYFPALGMYYLWLNHHEKRHHFGITLLYSGLGAGILFGIQTLIYYQLTGNWFIWQNSINASREGLESDSWRTLIDYSYGFSFSSWHILYLMTGVIATGAVLLSKRFRGIYGDNTSNFRPHLQATWVFFIGCYGIFGAWLILYDYHLYRLSFYSSAVLPSLFTLIGALFAGRVYRLSDTQFRTVAIFATITPIAFFALYTLLSPIQLFLIWLLALFLGMFFFVISFMVKKNASIINLVVAIVLLSLVSGLDRNYIGIYTASRYYNQAVYETVTEATHIINSRYDVFSLPTFRFWYHKDDPQIRTIHALTSVYLHQWGRRILAIGNESDYVRWDENLYTTQEIILLTSDQSPQTILTQANNILANTGYELHVLDQATIQNGATTLQVIFTQVRRIALSG